MEKQQRIEKAKEYPIRTAQGATQSACILFKSRKTEKKADIEGGKNDGGEEGFDGGEEGFDEEETKASVEEVETAVDDNDAESGAEDVWDKSRNVWYVKEGDIDLGDVVQLRFGRWYHK